MTATASRPDEDGLVKLALVALCGAAITIGFGVHGPVDRLASSEARRLVEAGAVMVDVRSPNEFLLDHAEGAVNVPVADIHFRFTDLPRDRKLLVYCRVGEDCMKATYQLRMRGFDARDLGPVGSWRED